jgi:hypothetical protein
MSGAVHTPHPSISTHGLADGCERCAEMALDPWLTLDDGNLARLVERTIAWMHDEEYPRSENEKAAMRDVERTLVRVRAFNRLGIEVPA